jgi:hypothetical protein
MSGLLLQLLLLQLLLLASCSAGSLLQAGSA